jgi:tetratricopeptide (TPR) repeat protein
MTDVPFAPRIVANLVIRERLPGEEALETVQWQMPDAVFRLFQREARRQKTDLNSLLRDIVCTALTEQAEAVRARNAELDQESRLSSSDAAEPLSIVVLSPPPLSLAEARQTAAEELIDRGWESRGVQRSRLAQKALALWPDGADAYVLLASTAKELEEARHLYEQGLAAGERALGADALQSKRGHFWGWLETRPYMRARHGLAVTLWALGERQTAIDHLWVMLELNPNDNQGMRELLASWLLVIGDDAGVARLLALYPEESSAVWAYTRALQAYRQKGVSTRATALLRKALVVNSHVPAYLLGRKPLPRRLPAFVTHGDASEAASYAVDATEAWRATTGALAWLTLVAYRPRGL